MKNILYLIIIVFCISCTEKNKGNFNIHGKIIGLKKGTIYLEKIDIDSIYILDSVNINNGQENFTFSENIKEGNLFSISLNKSLTKKVLFFSEPGEINFETYLNKFILKAKIKESKQQDLLNEHDKYRQKIQFQNLDIFKEKFLAQKNGDLNKISELENKYNQNLKRLYLFSANYAVNHNNDVIAAYIAVTRMENATPKLKKKIYDALTPKVKNSKYGLLLKKELDTTL